MFPISVLLYIFDVIEDAFKITLILCARGAREESKKFSDMNIDPFKGVGNGGVASSSGSSSLGPYLANGGNVDKSYHSLSNDFSFPPGAFHRYIYLRSTGI
ncbi:Serine/threonine protein phosphatase 2A 55 kDa regulatory subunit B alpha isoform [Camellia lanceoleosa]|uniref:Serine/threonine protein phosphatase 2A 55 kDa regulatory subunit B alpha isoform n=1 Tax=Camellia lanceoleosa TaxID=1840588 RepID=A0ACC0IMM2_9ERIC|nr:Serine/threonine protein phosphatase 2A 55 kDa regulatory subunit B alpha isoform [Camellia lanceoleosa]